jgi:hypothetical protein
MNAINYPHRASRNYRNEKAPNLLTLHRYAMPDIRTCCLLSRNEEGGGGEGEGEGKKKISSSGSSSVTRRSRDYDRARGLAESKSTRRDKRSSKRTLEPHRCSINRLQAARLSPLSTARQPASRARMYDSASVTRSIADLDISARIAPA